MSILFMYYNGFFDTLKKYGNDIFLLLIRVYVAWVFFKSGYLKLTTWDSTLYLFESEYQVPFISFELAAILGTASELFLPILLAFGLATRGSAFSLFIFNAIAVYSYPAIWAGGFLDHKLWGLMLLVIVLYGQGRIALDTVICKKYCV